MKNSLNSKIVQVIEPGVIKDNASFTVVEIDTLGFRQVDIYISFGAMDIAMAALKLKESDTASDGSAADVSGADFSVSPATLPSATDDHNVFAIHVDMRGHKRYLTLVATAGDGAAGTYGSAIAILSRAEQAPNTVAERGLTQELFV
jgi:hypothetical protein